MPPHRQSLKELDFGALEANEEPLNLGPPQVQVVLVAVDHAGDDGFPTGMDLTVCLLLGAIVSTTDPAAVIGIFRDVGAPKRLSILAEGESLLNDAVAIAAFGLFIGILVSRVDPSAAMPGSAGGVVLVFLREFIGGLVFQNPFLILAKTTRIEGLIFQFQIQKPLKHQVITQPLTERSIGGHTKKRHQQASS